MLRKMLNRIKLSLAKRDLELALYAESQLRDIARDHAERAEVAAGEAFAYRRHEIPAREKYLRECEIAVLADKIGKM